MLLHAQQISLAFGHLPLLDDAELRVESGERLALIGRNGTGKSTLLKVLSGELPPDRGLGWREPGLRTARHDQERLGQLADRPVYQKTARGLGPAIDLEQEEGWRDEQCTRQVISRLSLPADRRVAELSGGWRRRTLLAKALVSHPDLL